MLARGPLDANKRGRILQRVDAVSWSPAMRSAVRVGLRSAFGLSVVAESSVRELAQGKRFSFWRERPLRLDDGVPVGDEVASPVDLGSEGLEGGRCCSVKAKLCCLAAEYEVEVEGAVETSIDCLSEFGAAGVGPSPVVERLHAKLGIAANLGLDDVTGPLDVAAQEVDKGAPSSGS